MGTLSPLKIIYKALSEKIGGAEPLPDGQNGFGISFTFPDTSHKEQPQLEGNMWLYWNKQTRQLIVSSSASSLAPFAPWEGMKDFFLELTDNVQPFLEGEWPGGELTPFFAEEKNVQNLLPGYQTALLCPTDVDEENLRARFMAVRGCAAQALLFVRPIFGIISFEGRVPSVHERMRLLSIEFGRYEIFHQPEKEWPAAFPRGWYETRYASPDLRLQ